MLKPAALAGGTFAALSISLSPCADGESRPLVSCEAGSRCAVATATIVPASC